MKYLIAYKARRKNAKRHVITSFSRTKFFDSIDEAENFIKNFLSEKYDYEIYSANWIKVN